MLARCPECRTLFRVSASELKSAHGKVRCGICHSVFDALEALVDADSESPTRAASSARTPMLSGTAGNLTADRTNVDPSADSALAQALDLTVIEGLVPKHRTSGWIAGAVMLLMLLLGQIAWFQGARLLALFPAARPPLEWACARWHCQLPRYRDPGLIRLVSRDVRVHPRAADALLINALFTNHAEFPQPYPVLQLGLYDTDGQVLAARRFAPKEYLEKHVDPALEMPPGIPVHIVLEVQGPRKNPVSFEFKFL
ncbi:MAG: zinc-ribbon and DUF3426 domain-containing protein [Gammaproteobacteria bacterium]